MIIHAQHISITSTLISIMHFIISYNVMINGNYEIKIRIHAGSANHKSIH